ncbi:Smr/MutS family protein [Neisseria chenwenguii]|uniref:Smr domain protein n=1 Tax=Neisseria chenwenguii TaxID=1853278 RepID=A0A220S4A4_9NEIS|nr:Smr/MutS family protein [Neisseria chenwenguii]ASK28267.1 Smr domain protein [Neisseria chenwenguii]ROV57392.1 Smr domain protein [Neisseria chenwenguii]
MTQDFQSTLKALGKQAKKEAEARQLEAEEAKKREAENVDFAKAVGSVVPLKNTNRYVAPRDTSPLKPRPKDTAALAAEDYFYVGSGNGDEPPASFSKNGQGKNDLQRLRNGHYPVVADVDLHGYTQEEAQQVLNEFIGFVKKRGVCAEIVHGSGLGSAGYKPVLKNMTRRWLMQHPDVLAYVEPRAGNDGAVRILLKRRRVEGG